MPVIPATREVKVGGSWSKASQAKPQEPYLKNAFLKKERKKKKKRKKD
jgi:hypothetical protein